MILARADRGPVSVLLEAPARRVARGETLPLTITLEIAPGYRIESVRPPEPARASAATPAAARATAVHLGVAEGLVPGEMRVPEGSVDPLGGGRLSGYVGRVAFRVPLEASPECLPGAAPIAVRVLFQASGERSLEPDQIEISAHLEVDGATGAGPRDPHRE